MSSDFLKDFTVKIDAKVREQTSETEADQYTYTITASQEVPSGQLSAMCKGIIVSLAKRDGLAPTELVRWFLSGLSTEVETSDYKETPIH